MTQPNPDEAAKAAAEAKAKADAEAKAKAAAEAKAKADAAAPLELLEVVVFEHHDLILGGSRRAIGVVVGVDEHGVTVRPLTHHDVRVAPGDVERYDDAGDVDPVS